MSKKIKRKVISLGLSLGLSAAGCETRVEKAPPPSTAKENPNTSPDLRIEEKKKAAQFVIAPYAVDAENFARKTLYTWTSPNQINELRLRPILLTKSESETLGPSGFDKRVQAERGANYEMTELLAKPQLSLRRFAWTTPWATILGFQNEAYGNQLVKITLKDDALIASFTPGKSKHWDLVDLSNKSVDRDVLQEHPERLAAVYYEAQDEKGALLYREYVLCNESMIERWEYATPDIITEMSAQEDALRKLIEWARVAKDPKEVESFFARTTSFPGRPYTASVEDLTALADLLLVHKAAQIDAITATPTISFSEIGAAPIKAAPATPSCLGSYCPPPPSKPLKPPSKKSLGTF
jgi:hypothetical protein